MEPRKLISFIQRRIFKHRKIFQPREFVPSKRQVINRVRVASAKASSRLHEESEERASKTAWGLGRDGVVELVSIIFNSSFW